MWAIFEQTGPLANILGIAVPAFSLGGWLLGIFLIKRIGNDAAIKQHLDKVKGDLEIDLIRQKQALRVSEEARSNVEGRLAPSVLEQLDRRGAGAGEIRKRVQILDGWLQTEGPDVSRLLVERAKLYLPYAVGAERRAALWLASDILNASIALGGEKEASMLAADVAALISTEGHLRPGSSETQALRQLSIEAFDDEAVSSAMNLAEQAREHLLGGRFVLARETATAAESLFVANLGPAAALSLDCRRTRAVGWLKTGDYAEALEDYRHISDQLDSSAEGGPGSPARVMAKNDIVRVLLDMFKFRQGLWEIERVLLTIPPEAVERGDILESQILRARALEGLNRLEESLALFDETLAALSDSPDYGPTHTTTMTCRFQRISVLQAVGKNSLGLEEIDSWLADYTALRGYRPEHPDILMALQMRATALHGLKRFDEAIEAHRTLAKKYEASPDFGIRNHHALMCREALGGELYRVGRYQEAARELEHAVRTRSELPDFGPCHAITFLIRYQFAAALSKIGNFDESLEVLDELVLDQSEILGEDHEDTWSSIQLRDIIRKEWLKSLGSEQRKDEGSNEGASEIDFSGVGRNEICPCGSGLKYKNCHGKLT